MFGGSVLTATKGVGGLKRFVKSVLPATMHVGGV